MSPTIPLRPLIERVRRALRRDSALALALAALCAVPAVLLIAWLIGLVRPWSRPGFGPLLLELAALAVAGGLVFRGVRRWIDALDDAAVAADAERTAGLREGAVRGALELSRGVPEGTSPALARRAETEINARLAGTAPVQVAAALHGRVRRRRTAAAGALAALTLLTTLVAFAAPDTSRAAWAPLAHPVRNMVPPPLPPLGVFPGDVEVQRGGDLSVHVAAPGRSAVTVRWRMQGDVAREDIAPVSQDSAVATITGIEAPTEYWVEAPDGAVSRRFRAVPVDPLLLADLTIDVIYPRHAGRPSEHLRNDVPALEIPEGTQLVISGRATRPLAGAALRTAQEAAAVTFDVTGDRFNGSIVPQQSGVYAWQLRDARGGAPSIGPPPLEIVIVRDEPPQVEITLPATDTVLDASLRQPVVADARDDLGLRSAEIVSWRAGTGRTGGEQVQAIAFEGGERAILRTLLDAAERDLVPGDTLKFVIRVTDTSPRRQMTESRVVALRLPGVHEMRDRARDQADAMVDEAARLAGSASELQRATHDAQRRASAANARRRTDAQRSNRTGDSQSRRMDFDEAAPARQLLERQEALVESMEDMRRRLDALERAMQQSGLHDRELQQRMEELRQLYEQLLTPEMREQMEQLRKALEDLDPEALQRALESMAQQQQEMKEQLERSVELMRRAAAEQEMNNLAEEARELAAQQEALAQSMKEQPPTPQQAKEQKELAERAQELAKDIESMQERLRQQGEQSTAESAEQAQQRAAEAGRQMEQAARDAARQDGGEASSRGQSAAEQLEQAAESLDQARQAMADGWKQEAQEEMQQATADALALAQRQQELLDRMKQADQGGSGGEAQQTPRTPQTPQLPQPGVQAGEQQERSGQQGAQPQSGQQQGQQESGQQQSGQQGRQQSGQQQRGQQQGGQPNQQGRSGQQQQGGEQAGGRQGGAQGTQQQTGQEPGGGTGTGEREAMQAEQQALQQGLQQLGRNLQEMGERSAAVNREVGAALGRANLSMQQTLDQLSRGELPLDQAQQTVDALNRLALSLLNNSQDLSQGDAGGTGQEAMQQMADLARRQGSLNGQSSALAPMNLTPGAMSQQLNRLAAEQMEIARRLGELNRGGGREGLLGDVDALAAEAEDVARVLRAGTLPPEVRARQERLFHRMLDAGRSLEKDEFEEERAGERATRFDARSPDALDPSLFREGTRFRVPSPQELEALPPAYRRLILDYFERLNRPQAPQQEGTQR